MKTLNTSTLKAVVTLIEKSGFHAGEQYVGAARDNDGRNFLIKEHSYPVGFTVDVDNTIILNSEKLKKSTKFRVKEGEQIKDALGEYCKSVGLSNELCFQLNTMEKAITLVTLNNAIQQVDIKGNAVTEEDVLTSTVASVCESFDTMVSDQCDLARAMTDAGMVPVISEVKHPTDIPNIRVVSSTNEPITETNDLDRSDRLIEALRNSDNLSATESDLLDTLVNVVEYKRERARRLEEIRKDKSNLFAVMRGQFLTGPNVCFGLHRAYIA